MPLTLAKAFWADCGLMKSMKQYPDLLKPIVAGLVWKIGHRRSASEAIARFFFFYISWIEVYSTKYLPSELVPDHLDVDLLTKRVPKLADVVFVHPGLEFTHPGR